MDFQRDDLFQKLKSRPGLGNKLEAKCFDCTYDQEGQGTWRQQVETCGVRSCALYQVRPKSQAPVTNCDWNRAQGLMQKTVRGALAPLADSALRLWIWGPKIKPITGCGWIKDEDHKPRSDG